jgi:hypothetical protein
MGVDDVTGMCRCEAPEIIAVFAASYANCSNEGWNNVHVVPKM